jgi:drug/metabolite transporter (DMT)-like permease
MKKGRYTGHVAMLTANLMWGFMAPVSKAVLISGFVGYLSLTSFRVAGAAIVFWIASFFLKKEKVNRRDLALLFLASLFAIVLNQGTFVMGVSMTSPIDASIVTTTTPIITLIISAFYLKEVVTWKKASGIALGATGALLLILSGHHAVSGSRNSNIAGDLLCLFAQCSFSVYLVMFRNIIHRYSPVTLMKWMFTFASVFCIPVSFYELSAIPYNMLPMSIGLDIAFIVLGGTFFSYLLIPVGQKNLPPTVTSMYNYVQPVVASIVSILWGMGTFSVVKGFAVALVFSGVFMVTRNSSAQKN